MGAKSRQRRKEWAQEMAVISGRHHSYPRQVDSGAWQDGSVTGDRNRTSLSLLSGYPVRRRARDDMTFGLISESRLTELARPISCVSKTRSSSSRAEPPAS